MTSRHVYAQNSATYTSATKPWAQPLMYKPTARVLTMVTQLPMAMMRNPLEASTLSSMRRSLKHSVEVGGRQYRPKTASKAYLICLL